jgi:hypothetical protein
MAEVILRYLVDPETHVGSLVVDYRSEADALPEEHEADHREVVGRLLADTGEDGVTIDRVAGPSAAHQVPPPRDESSPREEPDKVRA